MDETRSSEGTAIASEESPLELRLDEPGSLTPPGPVGRLVRLAWGLLLLAVASSVWSERAALIGWRFPMQPTWWLGSLLLLAVFPYVVNIGFGVDGRGWPRRIVIGALATGIAGSRALHGTAWSPWLGWFVLGWQLYTTVHLGLSFLLAAALATPGCEMRALPHLWTLLTGRPAAEHYCPGHIDSIDRWERERSAAWDGAAASPEGLPGRHRRARRSRAGGDPVAGRLPRRGR